MDQQINILKRPTYILNIIYNNKGIYLSERTCSNKEMYKMLQALGGKVEKGESSIQAAIRETKEETGIELQEKHLTYLLNDPNYNCDVYITKVLDEPNKQGPWKIYTLGQYRELVKQGITTPKHTKFLNKIIENLTTELLVYVERLEEVQDALFAEVEVYGERINILIDLGAVGCIISKRFLDAVGRPIETATNIKIININGKRTTPLGLVRKVPIKIRDIETEIDMIVRLLAETREFRQDGVCETAETSFANPL
jgi:8-oxo-dGTP pyrophosphatase MutT (NUDIX family)